MPNTIKSLLLGIKTNSLIKGSLIILVGSIIGGVGNYVFHLLMGRMLGPTEYGVLASLISLTYIIGVPAQTINLVVSKNVAGMQGKEEIAKAKFFIKKALRKSTIFGVLVFLVFLSLTHFIKNFLHIDSPIPIIILGISFLLSFVSIVPTGGLTGLERFFDISINGIFATVLKIIFAILLVYLGWGVNGVLIAMLASGIVAMIHLFLRLKLPKEEMKYPINTIEIISYIIPVFITSLCLVTLYNMDVILTKHFLDSTQAGLYAGLALMGKMIFFATSAVGVVLFPVAAKNQSIGQSNLNILRMSLLLVSLGSLIITFVYFLCPIFIIKILLGSSYLAITPYLGWIGVVFVIYSMINILALYGISCKRTDLVYILGIGAILQVFLLSYFHSSIWQVIYVMIMVMSITLVGLFIPLLIDYYKSKKQKPA